MSSCLSCQSPELHQVLDLGIQPLANNLLREDDLDKPEPRFPLRLSVCQDCWMLQITDLVPPTDLFSEYLYFSSFSDQMLRHAKEASCRYIADFNLGADSFVVEIASNDGYLLKNFVERKVPVLGIEPAANIAEVAIAAGVESLVAFFDEKLAGNLVETQGQADLILGNNVFAHAPNTNSFVSGLKRLLKPSGNIVLEFPYGVEFINETEFDTIYHEHVFYFTLTSLIPLFERHGLQIQAVEQLAIHGGSLRLFVGHSDAHPIDDSVKELLQQEQELSVGSLSFYDAFAKRAESIKEDLSRMISNLKESGKSVAAYGASAKGSTLLNFLGAPAKMIDFIVDRSTHKQGRLSPGHHLPIHPPEALLEYQPDFTILLTWNFQEEIVSQQSKYLEAGGQFIVPIPKVCVV